ncbi:zinc ribbon domain-containing protein [Arthrobacter bambusae]|uniref:zinc ribbon domain-containing protein n=1 Tax=Arthrobacter bambusae TaxID=1338426 RepID=UPI001F512FFB|nr:zinc ribbon domain-containing protein [Arthrobacter bambusae]MCI0143166.1 zinc ribbon domain-containing protein [Arthrobacter bambusae]
MNKPQSHGSPEDDLRQSDDPSIPNDGLLQDTDPSGRAEASTIGTDPPTKVCPKCSVQTTTFGSFCPNCGSGYDAQRRFAKINKRAVFIVAAVLIMVASGIGIALTLQHSNQVNAEQAAATASAEASKKRDADDAQASASAAAAKQAADASERKRRQSIVTALEDSVLKDAQSRVTEGILTGPITLASCTPLGGGSSDDLTAITGTFQCIAVNKTNADGSSSGYRFSATVNWNASSYSWHLGS